MSPKSALTAATKVFSFSKTLLRDITPSKDWANGNSAVFGGWTMSHTVIETIKALRENTTKDAFQQSGYASPENAIELTNFKFNKPGLVGLPVEYKINFEDGVFKVQGWQDDPRPGKEKRLMVEADLKLGLEVFDYTDADFKKLEEIMGLLDLAGGRRTNSQYPIQPYEVCVTASIPKLFLNNIKDYVPTKQKLGLEGTEEGLADLLLQDLREHRHQERFWAGNDKLAWTKAEDQTNDNPVFLGDTVYVNVSCEDESVVFAHGKMEFANTARAVPGVPRKKGRQPIWPEVALGAPFIDF